MNSYNPEKHKYAACDPSWDYVEVWHLANQAQEVLEHFLKEMSQHEEWSSGLDHLLRQDLDQIESDLDQIESLLSRIYLDS